MTSHQYRMDELMALCILLPGDRTDAILAFFKARGVDFTHFTSMPAKDSRFWDLGGDLVLIDAEMVEVDIIQFLSRCRSEFFSVPVIALHSGAHGTRDAALIRMGAFDALSKNIDQWNMEIYLERAINQAAMTKKLLSLSWTDQLTGLNNRRFLLEDLEREIRRTARTSKNLTIALLDLDDFRHFNNIYGDLKGDDLLTDIARIILASVRQGIDGAYRYGGDEFLIILPETDLDQATLTLKRIVEKLDYRIEEEISFSIGLVMKGESGQAPDLLGCAEETLNRAKDSGGNSIARAVYRKEEDKWLDGTRRI